VVPAQRSWPTAVWAMISDPAAINGDRAELLGGPFPAGGGVSEAVKKQAAGFSRGPADETQPAAASDPKLAQTGFWPKS